MSGGHLAALLGSLAVVIYFVATPLLVRKSAQTRTPWGIESRLRSSSGELTVRVRSATWDPGSPLGRRSGWLYGSGEATYRLGDDGLVHLRFERRDGKVIESAGPVPHRAEVSGHRRALYGPLVIMAGAAALGGVGGLLIATPPVMGAAWGLLVGIGVGWVAATVVLTVRRVRRVQKTSV